MKMNDFPMMARIERKFPSPLEVSPRDAIEREFAKLGLADAVAGKKVGITAGSRGIGDMVEAIAAIVRCVRGAGGEPSVLAAMGSHGGGTAEGQKSILDSLGVVESSVGAPVITCGECRSIGTTEHGLEAYMLASAFDVDAIIAINRVKVHTAFHGEVESGLHKMLVVGLGGPRGSAQFHSRGSAELPGLLLEIGAHILREMPVVAGFAIVENAYDRTASITGVRPADFRAEERRLLEVSRSLMPALPADDLDCLIVEEMGKNFSGTGLDTNIIGRLRIEGVEEPAHPSIKRVAVLDLSDESHGNANGMGLADVTTQKLVDKLDLDATYLNCVTTGFLIRGATPVHRATERDAIALMLRSLGETSPDRARVIQTANTLHITDLFVSEALLPEVERVEGVSVVEPLAPMTFTDAGDLARRLKGSRR